MVWFYAWTLAMYAVAGRLGTFLFRTDWSINALPQHQILFYIGKDRFLVIFLYQIYFAREYVYFK